MDRLSWLNFKDSRLEVALVPRLLGLLIPHAVYRYLRLAFGLAFSMPKSYALKPESADLDKRLGLRA